MNREMRPGWGWVAFLGATAIIMVIAGTTPSSPSSQNLYRGPAALAVQDSIKAQPSIVVNDDIKHGARTDICVITIKNNGKGPARDFKLSWLQYGMQKPPGRDDNPKRDELNSGEDEPTPGVPMVSFRHSSYTIEPGKSTVIRIPVPKIPESTVDRPGWIEYLYSFRDADGLQQEAGDGHIPD